MKTHGSASENDLPSPLRDVLHSTERVVYCPTCDGLRVIGHTPCRPFAGWRHADGTPYTDEEELG